MTRRARLLVTTALLAVAGTAHGEGPASQPASAPASQPQVVPPALTRFQEARLPPDLTLAPGRHVVALMLTIDASGAVTEVEVRPPADPALARLAAEAARRFVFSPARANGVPVAVRVVYRYSFDVRPRARAVAHVFTVREKGSRVPVEGVTALVEENGRPYTATGDRLEVSDLPPGRYTLYVPAGEFAEARVPFTVAAGVVGQGRLLLERRTGGANQTIIRAPREARYVAKQSLDLTELARLPGSGGDPLKMVENLPGIARSSFGTGQLIVFGSAPTDSLVMLDSMPMWNLYHLGGLYSVIHPELIERIDFIPAGFDAGYGHITGGVVDVRLREEPLKAFHAALDVNFIHASLLAGIPYSKDGDLVVAFRRSYIDAILSAVMSGGDFPMTIAPRYYDYQLKWQHRVGRRHRFLVFVNGTDDDMRFVAKRSTMDDPTFVGDLGLRSYFHGALARWTFEPGATVRNALSLQASLVYWKFDFFEAMKFETRQVPLMLRDDFEWRLHRTLKLHAGIEAIANRMELTARSREPPQSGEVDMPMSLMETIDTHERAWEYAVGPFVALEWQPVPRLTVVPSLRVETWWGYRDWTYFDPRLSARLKVSETVALRLAGGLYHRPPDAATWSAAYGNPHIGAEAAVHLLGGGEWTPTARISVTTNLFYKWLLDLAEPSDDRTVRFTNAGRGRAYGGDLLVRVRPGGRLFGWIAYTYVRSERYDLAERTYRPSNYDQQHLLNVVASYQLPRRWTVGARFRLTSGYPYTPVVGAVFDSDADRYAPVPSPLLNSARVPAFHALDLRVDKEWVFASWKLGLYLEVQNVYNHRNAEGASNSYNYGKRGYVGGLPILPVFGIRGEL